MIEVIGLKKSRLAVLALAIAALILVLMAVFMLRHLPNTKPVSASSALVQFLSSDTDRDFARVTPGYRLSFPVDHAAHPEFRQEWWYFTGNLIGEDGREFGFQLTFFRFAHGRSEHLPAAGWNNDQTWMTHFAVTDVQQNRFFAEQDFARGALDLAGAAAEPFTVWVNGWSATQTGKTCRECLTVKLVAETDEFSIDLEVKSNTGPLLQGEQGFSVKNDQGDVASYYYSYPDLHSTGKVVIHGQSHQVEGTAWMDREWSSAVLAKGQSGWDWFALHLDDGRKLMLFQVRDEVKRNFRHAVLIGRGGMSEQLSPETLEMTPTDFWISPDTGNRYPTRWSIRNTSDDYAMELSIKPKVKNQELNLSFQYYEGAVEFEGELEGDRVSGSGYMELTGYERN